MKLLIIEDEPDIADGLSRALLREGFQSDVANNGIDGERLALENHYGAILLDLMLPGKDGRGVCHALRKAGLETPIIMLTARDSISDRVLGLDAGADDYLVKPFAIEEVLARIRAITRREAALRAAVIEIGGLKIDTRSRIVEVEGSKVDLTHREYDLLEALCRNSGRVLSRDAISERVFNSDDILPNTISFHMSSLRKKVDPDSKYIQTIHGMGYSLRPR